MSRRIAILLLIVHAGLLVRLAIHQSPTLDELPHLASGISHWEFANFELYRVNPPLVRMIAAVPVLAVGIETDWMGGWPDDPLGRPEFPLGRRLASANGSRIFMLLALARCACIPFLLLGGWVVFRWSSALFGEPAGLAALTLWCFDPNVLAWGGTICPDAPAAALGVAAAYAYWLWLRAPSGGAACLAGIATGLALLTKSTWIILWGVWPILWLAWRGCARSQPDVSDLASTTPASRCGAAQSLSPPLAQLAIILGVSWYVLNSGYGFAGAFRPLGEFRFVSEAFCGEEPEARWGNRFRESWLSHVPVPLPADYVLGIDVQRREFEQGKWSYLRGTQKHGGWWWYYLYAFGVKSPLGTLVLLAFACGCAVVRYRSGARAHDHFALLLPGLAVLVLVSSQTGFNRYLRYALPALPFLMVWIGYGVTMLWSRARPAGLIVVVAALLLSAGESLLVFPHAMAFFHRGVGGPLGGPRHLLDANVDWGQELHALAAWTKAHPQATPLFLADFGWTDPKLAGIESQTMPRLWRDSAGRVIEGDPSDFQPGWYAISVNHLCGYRHYDTSRSDLTWLNDFDPIAAPGYAYRVFHLSAGELAAWRTRTFGSLERHEDSARAN